MKKIKQRICRWLLNQLRETPVVAEEVVKSSNFSEEQLKRINFIKSIFKTYFDGCYMVDPVIENLPTSKLGITNIEFEFKGETLIMNVTLLRPGLLIGKGGRTINDLSDHLNNGEEKPVEVHITESKIWDRVKN